MRSPRPDRAFPTHGPSARTDGGDAGRDAAEGDLAGLDLAGLDLAGLAARFAPPGPGALTLPPGRTAAAIALVAWQSPEGLALCFMERARFGGDPWSGDMAFPGGKADAGETRFDAVAAREVEEEVGLDLAPAALLGALPAMVARGQPDRAPLTVCPLVYGLICDPPAFCLSPEVASAHWVPLSHLLDPAERTTLRWRRDDRLYPAIRLGRHRIWGFTFRVLEVFFDMAKLMS